MTNDVFISYSRRDLVFAKSLVLGLKEKGVDPWFDQEDIPPASLWENEIKEGINKCSDFVFLISEFSCKSLYCLIELNQALLGNKRIIPIACPQNLIEPAYVHASLKELNWIFFDNFKEGLAALVSSIESPEAHFLDNKLSNRIMVCTEGLIKRVITLKRGAYIIGRNPKPSATEGDITLDDPWVSRKHLRLTLSKNRWMIENLSQNGTIVNNHSIQCSQPLRNKDEIILSPVTRLVYEELFATEILPVGSDKSTLV